MEQNDAEFWRGGPPIPIHEDESRALLEKSAEQQFETLRELEQKWDAAQKENGVTIGNVHNHIAARGNLFRVAEDYALHGATPEVIDHANVILRKLNASPEETL
jgi:hypothetical protein